MRRLGPDYPPHKVLGVLARYENFGSVAIVGHRPGLHELVSYLLTGDMIGEDCGARVQIKKGGAARLSFDGPPEPGAGSLEWLLTPKVLRGSPDGPVGIGSLEHETVLSDGSFEVEEGKLAFAPGSSGWTGASGEETLWTELFLRSGSAWEEFGHPPVGAGIKIEAG